MQLGDFISAEFLFGSKKFSLYSPSPKRVVSWLIGGVNVLLTEYHRLVGQWRRVCDATMDDTEKVAAFVAVWEAFIERKVFLAIRSPNPAIRFYANMVSLEVALRPYFTQDVLVQLAIAPAHIVVRNWLDSNTFPMKIGTPTFANHLMIIP